MAGPGSDQDQARADPEVRFKVTRTAGPGRRALGEVWLRSGEGGDPRTTPGCRMGQAREEIGRRDWARRLGQRGHCPSVVDLCPHAPLHHPRSRKHAQWARLRVGGVSPAGLEEEVVGKSERNCCEGRPGRAGPRWFLLRKQWAQLHGCSPARRTITVTQLAASPQAAGDLPHWRLPRPALHHMSP